MSGKKASGNSALKRAIEQLEQLLIEKTAEVSTLTEEKRALSTREAAVRLIDAHTAQLVETGELLRLRRGLPSSGRATPAASGGGSSSSGGGGGGGHASGGSGSGSGAAAAGLASAGWTQPLELPLEWCAEAAAARAGSTDVSTEGLRRRLRGVVMACAPLLM